jgi:hypothetical protein
MAELLDMKFETIKTPTIEELQSNPVRVKTNSCGFLVIYYFTPYQLPNYFAIDKGKYQGSACIWNSKNNNYDVYIIMEGNTKIRVASVCEQLAGIIVQTIEQELTKTDK